MTRLATLALLAAALVTPAAAAAQSSPVTWDRHSLRIDGRPLFVSSGEVHPFRMPGGAPAWREVLATLRASGLNTISIYVPWQLHEPAPGEFRFSGRYDLERFLQIARDEHLYVIVRPGPYIQGEIDGGGYPSWLLGGPGILRTREPAFTAAWKRWYGAVMPRIARWQVGGANRGTVIAVQVENEHPGGGVEETPPAEEFIRDLVATAKADGVTVPVTHNDVQFVGQLPSRGHYVDDVDVFGFDNYPYGFTCCEPWNESTFSEQVDGFEDQYRSAGVTDSPLYTAEIQGGLIAFEDDGKTLEDRYRTMTGYETVQTISLLGQGLTMINRYMTFGGTTWGNLVYPNAGTDYDYAAPVREWRSLGPRFDDLRRIDLQVRAAGATIARTERVPDATVGVSDGDSLYRVRESLDGGALHVFLRNADPGPERTPTVTVDGRTTPPVPLPGQGARWLLARANLAGWRIDLSSAEVAHADRHRLVLFGDRGRRYAAWIDGHRHAFTPRARPEVRRLRDGRRLVIVTRDDAARTWVRRGRLVIGPLLVTRHVVQTGRPTPTTIVGRRGKVRRLRLRGPRRVRLPGLRGWRTAAGTPERDPAFDDSGWTRATKTTTANQMQPNTSPVLYADDNGVPGSGFIWYRGRFTGTASGLCVEGRHRYHVWLNGQSLGTVTSDAEVPGPQGLGGLGAEPPINQPARLAFPDGAVRDGENVLAVLVESYGHNMDAGAANQAKQPRGLLSASLERLGSPPCGWTFGTGGETAEPLGGGAYATLPSVPRPDAGIDWRLHGATPRDYPNTSGLDGERLGWHRRRFDDSGWATATLPEGLRVGQGELAWYRTRFRLRTPRRHWISVGLDLPRASQPALVYLNGVQIARAGRSREERFVLPAGVLRTRGRNTLAIARWNVGESDMMDAPALHLYEVRRRVRLP